MGYLGMVGGSDPCLNQIESIYAARPIAFRASPYGVSHEFAAPVATLMFVPYLIDPVTLEIEWRPDLIIGPFSEGFELGAVLDDATMIFHDEFPTSGSGPFTSELRVLTRSGITIAMSGAQQSVTIALPEVTVIRLDSSHFLRRYNIPAGVGTPPYTVVEVFSVSGSTISLDASTSWNASINYTVTRDGGEAGTATLLIGNQLFPFKWDGAGTLYCGGFGATGLARIHAAPFSLGGSITAPDLSWRSRDAQNVGGKVTGKEGSSECLLVESGGLQLGFYDDGSEMHYISDDSSPWISALGYADLDHESTYGDYLAADVVEYPPGTTVADGLADLVLQSGTSLSYAPLDVHVLCPDVTGLDIAGAHGPTRHDVALGAVSQGISSTVFRLFAFSW